jgi:RND family efflux transporter MFP subunit
MSSKNMTLRVFTLSLCLFCLVGCRQDPENSSEIQAEPQKRPVKTLTLTSPDLTSEIRLEYPGKVRAARKVNLSFRVSGPLVELPVIAGQYVQKGQLLAEIDPRDYRINLSKAKAAFVEAERQYKRHETLLKRNAIPRSTFDRVESGYQVAKARYKAARAALTDTRLEAPFSGLVAQRYVENYQDVMPKQPIISLQDVSDIEVVIQVPQRDLVHARKDNIRNIVVNFPALPGRIFPASLKEISTEADPVTQTYQLTVSLPAPHDVNILPGMTAQVKAVLTNSTPGQGKSFWVPVESVLEENKGKRFCWVLNQKTMQVHKTPVSMGRLKGSSIEVTKGLASGQTIVTAGVHHLREGMKVTVLSSMKGTH